MGQLRYHGLLILQTATSSTTPAGLAFASGQSTTTIQFGGTTTGTAGTITVHSSKFPTVGAMIFAKPNSGNYTVANGSGGAASLQVLINLAGVADAVGTQGSGNYGIVMN